MKLSTRLVRTCGQALIACSVLAPGASAQTPAVKTNAPPLNDEQRRIEEWTARQFRGFLDNRTFAGWSKAERDTLETKTIDALNGPQSREYYQAISTLGALRSTNAVPPLLGIATDPAEKDNRDRWMAIRALGQLGDTSVVPELILLVYHGNVNTRWCAQISLVRLTGTNFGGDWRAWGAWWNHRGGQPVFATNDFVRWSQQPGWTTLAEVEAKLQEGDSNFFAKLPPASKREP
ncbi:MAG TPA: HEAT repeat domain-containing protein [Candidatus Limnocylindria bacterium]|nr:HEAT repeat domain-containing protein [Candidatus Limnocylindria bacterium]